MCIIYPTLRKNPKSNLRIQKLWSKQHTNNLFSKIYQFRLNLCCYNILNSFITQWFHKLTMHYNKHYHVHHIQFTINTFMVITFKHSSMAEIHTHKFMINQHTFSHTITCINITNHHSIMDL